MPITRKAPKLLYSLAIARHRLKRHMGWFMHRKQFASEKATQDLPFRVHAHHSILLRKLGDADMRLQHNKVTNLRLAAACMDRILIKPGETFSLWKLVGKPTSKRGFLPGMMLSKGEVIEGIGGGLCQTANLIYWMALHSPLTIVERYRHSFDPFPDSGRVLPFGSGATIFYNYIDLQLRNDTQNTFEIRLWLDENSLRGELRSEKITDTTYHIFERNHHFYREMNTGLNYRGNQIWREVLERRTGKILGEEMVCANFCEMKYPIPENVQPLELNVSHGTLK